MSESAPGGSEAPTPRLICRCRGISSLRIATAIERERLTTLEQVIDATGAGTGCSSCHPEIAEILAAATGRQFPEEIARRNRVACLDATRGRVERAVFQDLAMQLPAGTQLELVSVQGLSVELHLHGHAPAQVIQELTNRLRKLVCEDLRVCFC